MNPRCWHCSSCIEILSTIPSDPVDWGSFYLANGYFTESIFKDDKETIAVFCTQQCLWSYRLMTHTHLRLVGVVSR